MQWWAILILGSLPAPVADWSFRESQERFIVESVGYWEAVRSLPQHSRELLGSFLSDNYRHREWASREMQRHGDVRACFLGQWCGSLEVRTRCRNVLRRLSDCPQCEGRGGKQESWGLATCGYCRGAGHFWPPDDWEGM